MALTDRALQDCSDVDVRFTTKNRRMSGFSQLVGLAVELVGLASDFFSLGSESYMSLAMLVPATVIILNPASCVRFGSSNPWSSQVEELWLRISVVEG